MTNGWAGITTITVVGLVSMNALAFVNVAPTSSSQQGGTIEKRAFSELYEPSRFPS
jgi:hypothetical protein